MLKGTTIVSVRDKHGRVALGGDGQVTMGDTIVKPNAVKIREIQGGRILVGFAGSTADGLTLFELFERKVEKHQGKIFKAAVDLAKDWRMDKILRRLEAMMAVVDQEHSLIINGMGDVLEPEGGLIAIGSGGNYARAAAMAMQGQNELSAYEMVERSLNIAADICVYSNHHLTIKEVSQDGD